MNEIPLTPASAQDTSWTREARRAKRELPWFHDKPLGDARDWSLHFAILGFLAGGVAPAAGFYTVGGASFALAHIAGTTLAGLAGGWWVGRFLHARGDLLRARGLGAFAVLSLLVGVGWGALVGGLCGPALVWMEGSIVYMTIGEWMLFSGGPSAVAAGVTCAWFAPAFAALQATRKKSAWLLVAALPISAVLGVVALGTVGVALELVERVL